MLQEQHPLHQLHDRQERPMADALLTARQVQDRLDVDTSTIYRMAGDGRLPAVRIGRQWRFPSSAIDALLTPGYDADVDVVAPSRSVPSTVDPGTSHVLPPTDTMEAALVAVAPGLGVSLVVTDLDGRPLTSVVNPAPAIATRLEDPNFLDACGAEWRALAAETDLTTRLQAGVFGFLCARSLVRHGNALVAMVLAGGIAPDGSDDPGLFHLDDEQRDAVLQALPRIASLLSHLMSDVHHRQPHE
jgi:excisionase family DNA binding protein